MCSGHRQFGLLNQQTHRLTLGWRKTAVAHAKTWKATRRPHRQILHSWPFRLFLCRQYLFAGLKFKLTFTFLFQVEDMSHGKKGALARSKSIDQQIDEERQRRHNEIQLLILGKFLFVLCSYFVNLVGQIDSSATTGNYSCSKHILKQTCPKPTSAVESRLLSSSYSSFKSPDNTHSLSPGTARQKPKKCPLFLEVLSCTGGRKCKSYFSPLAEICLQPTMSNSHLRSAIDWKPALLNRNTGQKQTVIFLLCFMPNVPKSYFTSLSRDVSCLRYLSMIAFGTLLSSGRKPGVKANPSRSCKFSLATTSLTWFILVFLVSNSKSPERFLCVGEHYLRNKCGRRGVGWGNPRVRWEYRLHWGHSPRYSVLSPYSKVLPQPSLRLPHLFQF